MSATAIVVAFVSALIGATPAWVVILLDRRKAATKKAVDDAVDAERLRVRLARLERGDDDGT